METNNYLLIVDSFIEKRTITVLNACKDEAISFGISFFDKYATKINDKVIIYEAHEYEANISPIREIILKQGNRVEVNVL